MRYIIAGQCSGCEESSLPGPLGRPPSPTRVARSLPRGGIGVAAAGPTRHRSAQNACACGGDAARVPEKVGRPFTRHAPAVASDAPLVPAERRPPLRRGIIGTAAPSPPAPHYRLSAGATGDGPWRRPVVEATADEMRVSTARRPASRRSITE